ncbi:MAG: beta-hydroxyacyl-ACP dehydratase [Phycisphaerales bacterium]|jgi:3-hydroxyacyl-[acyl-carrier-protein] dehydratase|nr:beta-hydroxyacyl-ACP dehydratase [Phycisphaerales bacterium]MBT7170819.1 beta-hydroxyacyl-ACP dehydratase [Phycisphaerales bacterium]
MPPKQILDLSMLDDTNIISDREEIYGKYLPHRFEFERLDAIIYNNTEEHTIAGYRDLPDDEFWIRGHIPGRPIFPGVMMIETAAQLVSYAVMTSENKEGFLGFAAVDEVKFRGSVAPGQRIMMVGKMIDIRARRCVGYTQAYVEGKMVYEGKITGMWL